MNEKRYIIKVRNGIAKRYDTLGNSYNEYPAHNVVSGFIQENEATLTLADGHVLICALQGSMIRLI
jgi:hypothetical protein